MARYGRDFMGRVRGMWDRFSEQLQPNERGPRHGRDYRPMQATGPGGEGYFLSRDMARDADYGMDYTARGWDNVGDRGFPPGGMAQFGRAGAGRGYGGDYRTGRGGPDAGEFFVNRQGGDTGYHGGYERDLGMQRDPGMPRGRGMAAGGRGYGAEYTYGGFATGYDRGYRGGGVDGGRGGYSRDFRDMDAGLRSYYGSTYRQDSVLGQGSPRGGRELEGSGRSRPPFPRTYGR